MNIENSFESQEVGKNREALLALEREGKYVFHGSPDSIDVLEPRQAYDQDRETGEMVKDGDPAVFATPYADVAIFRALINRGEGLGDSASRFGIENEELHFGATQNLLDQAKTVTGKVYVLDKSLFGKLKGMQQRSEKTIIPVQVVDVSFDDLPINIEVIEEER